MMKFVLKCFKYCIWLLFYNLCYDFFMFDWKGWNSFCDVVLEWVFGVWMEGRVVGKLEILLKRGL